MQTLLEKSKYGKSELTLLAIFAIGLILSNIMVLKRSEIKLSPPIELQGSGLSVRIPVGNTWNSAGKWQYNPKDNSFDLSSALQLGNQVESRVICRYSLAPEPTPASDRISDNDMGQETVITDSGRISTGQIDIYWLQLAMGGGMSDSYIAEADLPDGRTLSILIFASADEKTATILLESICESIEFKQNQLLENGSRFVDRLKDLGVVKLTQSEADKNSQIIYLLKKNDSNAENDDYVGFAFDVFQTETENNEWVAVNGQTFYHTGSVNGLSSSSLYEISDDLDRMIWQTKLSTHSGRNEETVEIEFAEDGLMRITQLRPVSEKTFWPGQAAIPDMLLDCVSRAFVDHSTDEILLDVVSSRGSILPTVLKHLDSSEFPELLGLQISYGVRMEFVHMPGYGQNIFFDADKKIIAKVDLDGSGLTWIRSDWETLLKVSDFEPWREHIIRILNIN